MNNWRLLLALVAIFQPIASFTGRNLVDGRQQCCGRETDSFLRDAKSSIYGIHRATDDLSPLQRLNRDEAREDRQYELRQRDIRYTHRSTDRSLRDIRERNSDRLSIISRSNRVDLGHDRVSNDENQDRRLNIQRRQLNVGNVRDVNMDQSRRGLSHVARRSVMRYDDRTKALSSRNILSRDNIRINAFGNEYQIETSHREKIQGRSGDFARITATRDARDKIRQMKQEVFRINVDNNRQNNARERVNSVPRESLSRHSVSRDMNDNRELRERARLVLQQWSVSENSIAKRFHDVSMRVNSNYERKKIRERVDDRSRLNSERIEERRGMSNDFRQFREQINVNTERRLTGERIRMGERVIREYDTNVLNVRADRHIESRRDVIYRERLSSESRVDQLRRERRGDSGVTKRMSSLKRDDRIINRNVRSDKLVQGRGHSRRQIEYRNKMVNRERDSDNLSRNLDFVRNRELMINKDLNEGEETVTNWKYILYTLQGLYICGLLMQMLTPSHAKKSNKMKLSWWPLGTQELIKVD